MTQNTAPADDPGREPQGDSGRNGYAYDAQQHPAGERSFGPGAAADGSVGRRGTADASFDPDAAADTASGLRGTADAASGLRAAADAASDPRATADASSSHRAAAEAPGIVCEHVSRSFGTVRAVHDLSFTAPRGAVNALVGPNGSGKSTLMLMLASLLAPESGRVLVGGVDPSQDSAAVRAMVGWMPDQFGAWDSLRVSEVLEVMGRAYFMPSAQIRSRVQELLTLMDLEPLAQQPAHVLSRGQKQRLGLARALVHGPQVLILDEPASGLDPASRRRLLTVVRQVAEHGATVLVSSHILTELEEMADHVVFVDHGHVVDSSSVRDLAARPRAWKVQSLDPSVLHRVLGDLGVRHHGVVGPDRTTSGHAEAVVDLPDEGTAVRLLRDLTAKDAAVVAFGPATGRLEAAYLASDAATREGAL
ncbi:ABC transporter ATP-binding protein [Brachybacterium alimentarium]|uniref:ABC transporter ATP-binding protein n=1 Tax=Brachybacterium alimentarium TaxID=47845 RepID=UPI000DF141E7|nr:ABC transporter ATP-binding protein [Brachybacterium alimentarium]RCS64480.1 ABC transporter ATP-binding protein [Brachybacterium alimentarium]